MIKYYIQNGNCGTETAFKIIGAKWKPLILHLCISSNGQSYQELKEALDGIVDTILTKQLKELVEDEMLKKIPIDNKKNRSVYIITQKTKDIMQIMELMKSFADSCNYETSGYNSRIEYTKFLIGNKWKSRIIWVIYNSGTIRFNELLNCIDGLSHKVLIETLATFVENGFINKMDYNEKSPRVEYSLTEKGKLAYKIINQLADWCLKYQLIKPTITITY